MAQQHILFHMGLSGDARSALLPEGFLNTADSVIFEKDGITKLRPFLATMNSTAGGDLDSIRHFRDNLIGVSGTNLYMKSAAGTGNFTTLYSTLPRIGSFLDYSEYKDMLHVSSGGYSLLMDVDGNSYPANVPNPATACAGAAGAAGNPDGTYALYCSYLITFANGNQYETGISPISADVVVATQKISWSSIPTSSYTSLYGTAPTIHRKLYRGPGTAGTLADIYYVTTITDNTTTTYTDDASDATLAANGACNVDDYLACPDEMRFIAHHYSRFFFIYDTYPNRIYFTETPWGDTATENEVLMPLAIQTNNWDDIRAIGYRNFDIQGLIPWGTYLYIPLKDTWLRKDGNDPTTWSYKKTWSTVGVAASNTIVPCDEVSSLLFLATPRNGVPALAVFNGQTTQLVTKKKINNLLADDMNVEAINACCGRYDGRYYYLAYPSGVATKNDKLIVFDFAYFPDIRCMYWKDSNTRCIDIEPDSSYVSFGGSDGYHRLNTGGGDIEFTVKTKDLALGENNDLVTTRKTLNSLKYAIDTDGDSVTLNIYIDGELATWGDDSTSYTISGTDDTIQKITGFPPNFEGYKFNFEITGTVSTMELYSPWEIEYSY